MFNEDTFLDMQFNQAFSTEYPLCPIGDHISQLTDAKLSKVTLADQSIVFVLEVMHNVQDFDGPNIRQGIWLDTTADGQGLDNSPGKNVQLGRLRESVGQNIDGQTWNPRMLIGRAVKVKVGHRPDKKNPRILYNEIQDVSPVTAGQPTVAVTQPMTAAQVLQPTAQFDPAQAGYTQVQPGQPVPAAPVVSPLSTGPVPAPVVAQPRVAPAPIVAPPVFVPPVQPSITPPPVPATVADQVPQPSGVQVG